MVGLSKMESSLGYCEVCPNTPASAVCDRSRKRICYSCAVIVSKPNGKIEVRVKRGVK
tara:strand:+ start:121 stop:294 length:174 start_codon:yes stop_codon:yes gene_type:complete